MPFEPNSQYRDQQGREPISPPEEVNAQTVHVLEKLLGDRVRTWHDFDILALPYFEYLESELKRMDGQPFMYPVVFYDREINSAEELAEVLLYAFKAFQKSISDRGAGHHGQVGDYFWDESPLEELQGSIRSLFSRAYSLYIEPRGTVSVEAWVMPFQRHDFQKIEISQEELERLYGK